MRRTSHARPWWRDNQLVWVGGEEAIEGFEAFRGIFEDYRMFGVLWAFTSLSSTKRRRAMPGHKRIGLEGEHKVWR